KSWVHLPWFSAVNHRGATEYVRRREWWVDWRDWRDWRAEGENQSPFCKGGLKDTFWLLPDPYIHGGDAAGQVEMLDALEPHLGHHRLEGVPGRELQHGIGQVLVGAEPGEGAADHRQHLQKAEVVQGPEERRGRSGEFQDHHP